MADDDLSTSVALVIDGNQTSRSILVTQLKDFGMGEVVQSSRIAQARQMLETKTYDVVLCEQDFESAGDSSTGQDLLDDLRRNQLLPFSTVFIMVTAQASYSKVAEAAESALDGYLLKPHKASNLGIRLRQARHRKSTLQAIFTAIEAHEFDRAARMCVDRFRNKDDYWLYSARVGAELMLRTGQHTLALALYEAVVAAKDLPWAKLGIARAVMEAGQLGKARKALETLVKEDPRYAEASDALATIQFEQGQYTEALEMCRRVRDLTPACIGRNQSFGMMSFYVGDHKEAEATLTKTVRLGLDSKVFDAQSLVVLAMCHVESGDTKGLPRCQIDIKAMLAKFPNSRRLQRFAAFIECLTCIQKRDLDQALAALVAPLEDIKSETFDFATAGDIVSILSMLAAKGRANPNMDQVIDTLSLRFCSSRPLTEMLSGLANQHPPFAARIKAGYDEMLKLSENAMEHSLAGDPQATVEFLLKYGADTLNVRLLDTAHQVLQRYAEKLSAAVDLRAQAQELRALYCTAGARPSLGEQRERQAGRLSLRTAVVAKPTVVAPIALSEIEPDPAPSPSPSSASSETPAT